MKNDNMSEKGIFIVVLFLLGAYLLWGFGGLGIACLLSAFFIIIL